MASSKGTLLRYIHPNGGLFTENSLLKLRDKPNQIFMGKLDSFIKEISRDSKEQFKRERKNVFNWCIGKWDEITTKIDEFSRDELASKWLMPFFNELGHNLEPFNGVMETDIDDDSPFKSFRVTHHNKGIKALFFQIVNPNEDLNSSIDSNPQRKTHHDTCQQFVNLHQDVKWLLLSNGRILRALTKYYYSYSKGYVEFDLENIFANRDIQEFNLMYSLLHVSRFKKVDGEDKLLLDAFQEESLKEGVKVGDSLRDNVHDAIELLGDELIHQNPIFKDLTLDGKVDLNEYYAELLRIIYRIFFILYAEQRDMLPGAGSLYFEQFSLSTLRMMAEKPLKKDPSCDLWKRMFLTFKLVKDGNPFLEIPCYDGRLFDDEIIPIIKTNELMLSNELLLKVIKLLTTTAEKNIRQRINFLEISEEEIGAIYESLLDFKPFVSESSQFQLIYTTTDRKSTGSYYTPKELIDILIKTTLQQLVKDRLKDAGDSKSQREKVLLDIKVCDPACGGGTFLLSALDYLGEKLAEVRTGINNPSEDVLRHARRDVLQHCIYGVDKNPLAVELAKISLWLRACVKDKPLNYLDNHVKCGNSLVGLGQKKEIKYINPDAFKAIPGNKSTGIEGENKSLATKAKNFIKKEIQGIKTSGKMTRLSFFLTEKKTADICSVEFQKVIDMPEDDPFLIKKKELKYKHLKQYSQYQQALNEANIWTSAYFWSLERENLGDIPSMRLISELREGVKSNSNEKLLNEINKIADQNQFFHWYIEFPEVFSEKRGGFDCMLGNPPWDALQLNENEYFTGISEQVLLASTQAKRHKVIKSLKETKPRIFNNYVDDWKNFKRLNHFLSNSNLYRLSAKGRLNTYPLFLERSWNLLSKSGKLGVVVPTGIIMNYYMQEFFQTLVNQKVILSIFDFENRNKIFDIDSRFRFCLISLNGGISNQASIPMAFYSHDPKTIQEILSILENFDYNFVKMENSLPDESDLILLESGDFVLYNPNTLTCPSLRTKRDARLLKQIYSSSGILLKRDSDLNEILDNPWKIKFYPMFDMSGDSNLFISEENLIKHNAKPVHDGCTSGIWADGKEQYFPLYEGRMIWHYDHRRNSMGAATKGGKRKSVSIETQIDQYRDVNFSVKSNYWIRSSDFKEKIPPGYIYEWFLVFRDITGSTNERSFVSSIIPFTAVNNKLPIIVSNVEADLLACFYANLNSLAFDYSTRQKISGVNMNFFIVEQFPVFKPQRYTLSLISEIKKKVLELTFCSFDVSGFAESLGYNGEPFSWDEEERKILQAQLDAIFFHLYKIKRVDVGYILETFPVLKRKEFEKYGEFKTKNLILNAYDYYQNKKELFEG
ncbi:MAG: Eco57I restriction-modification methylase domain-containing protein [Promethearchaeota archaeon]